MSPAILQRAAILYLNVSYEESLRKNRLRARPGQESSVLYHSLPDEKMERIYKINDWDRLASDKQGALRIQGIDVPYAVFDNEPDRTSDPAHLGPALMEVFDRLQAMVRHITRECAPRS